MTATIISHLVCQGDDNPEDIAVLTIYLGQLTKLWARMAAESTFAVSLGARGLEELEQLEEEGEEVGSLPDHIMLPAPTDPSSCECRPRLSCTCLQTAAAMLTTRSPSPGPGFLKKKSRRLNTNCTSSNNV